MSYTIELTEQKERPVLSVRTRTPMDNLTAEIGKAYGAIFGYLGELGESPAGIPFAAYYNMDMQDLDVEIGVPVAGDVAVGAHVARPLAGKGEVRQSVIPAGRQVSCVYKGPYGQIGPAYEALTAWIAEKNLTATGVCYEFYMNEPGSVPEDELLTQIVFPVR